MRWRQLLLLPLLISQFALAYNYNEHKAIGNAALTAMLPRLMAKGYLADSAAVGQFLASQLHLRFDSQREEWIFNELSTFPNTISYGDLNGLAGDHDSNPLAMSEQLSYNYSLLNRIVQLQDQYGSQFYTSAPDKKLLNTDFQYGLLALTNFNHFYAYGKSLTWHLQSVDRQDIVDLMIPANAERVFNHLKRENAIRMYATLHAVAIQLAQQAGQSVYRKQEADAQLYLFYAVLFNAFADHFLEDMCAAGHMVVKRSLAGGITNNRSLHDFYNRVGLQVVNLQGTTWKTNGDGSLNIPENKWDKAQSFAMLIKEPVTIKYQRAIHVVNQSLFEVLDTYFKATKDGQANFIQTIPGKPGKGESDLRETFYVNHFGALSLVPLPLDSDIKRYFSDNSRVKEFTRINRIPFYRNYVRSRVANNVVVGNGKLIARDNLSYTTINGRIILSSKHFTYRDRAKKAGTFDTWRGLTAAFMYGLPTLPAENIPSTELPQAFYQIKGGLNLTGDLWLTNNTYIGLHSYLETGIQVQNGTISPFVCPSLGIQFLPFVGTWSSGFSKVATRLLQLFVSQKFIVGYQFIGGKPLQALFQTEIDISL